jgi:hypothetical protein
LNFLFIVVNQSDHEEKQTNQITPPSPQTSTTQKSVDDLLLLDLDPLNSVENHSNNTDEDKLERLKQDLEELYAQSTVVDTPAPVVTTSTLPDIIGQQEDLTSTSIPLAVEQLEIEVRQEILQHTLEQPSSSLLLPDVTALANDNHEENKETILVSTPTEEEENLSSTPVIETLEALNNFVFQNEPDLIQHETTPIPTPTATQPPIVLHSVDSIVNIQNVADLKVIENSRSFIQMNLVS